MITEPFDVLFSAYLTGACSKDQLEALLAIVTAPENRDWVAERISEQLAHGQPQSRTQPIDLPSIDLSSEEVLRVLQKSLDENLQQVFQRIDTQSIQDKHTQLPQESLLKSLLPGFAPPVSKRRSVSWLAIAAAAVVALFIGLYWWNQQPSTQAPASQIAHARLDFKPGKNAAILTIDGGSQIYLDSHTTGAIARQGNSSVTSINGQIKYSANRPTDKMVYNNLATSNGNQYRLVLPDGTKVWLNAASSIRYPVAFNGTTREVEIKGEVYLEVRHNEEQPFIVKAGGQTIEDIGTSFNVHAYPDEKAFSTTLVEGRIKVGGTVLQPGTQAQLSAGQLIIKKVDTNQVVAWKNGLFAFHQTPVKEVMRQIARWYDVEVVYQGAVPTMRFGGKISRKSNASVVMTILKKSGLEFNVQGRKIIITGAKQL